MVMDYARQFTEILDYYMHQYELRSEHYEAQLELKGAERIDWEDVVPYSVGASEIIE